MTGEFAKSPENLFPSISSNIKLECLLISSKVAEYSEVTKDMPKDNDQPGGSRTMTFRRIGISAI